MTSCGIFIITSLHLLNFCGTAWAQPRFRGPAAVSGADRLALGEPGPGPGNAAASGSVWGVPGHAAGRPGRDPDTTDKDQPSDAAAEQADHHLYVGLQTGVLLIWPFAGITAGFSPAGLPGWAIEADYAVALYEGKGYPWYAAGLVWGKRKPRGSYFRLGLGKLSEDDDTYAEIAGGWRMSIHLRDSVHLRPQIGLWLFIPVEKCYGCWYIPFPIWDLRLKMELDL